MKRPVMNPMFMDEPRDGVKKNALSWRRWIRPVWRVLRIVGKVLLTRITLLGKRGPARPEDGTPLQIFCRALLCRLVFVPISLALFLVCMVYCVTHPSHHPPEADPLSQGVYYDPVNVLSDDGTLLDAWLVPAYEARRILADKDKTLTKKHPAVILVHDFDGSRQQLLPLVQPLHELGMVVLVVGMRGTGPAKSSGQTFGLRESGDVRSAVQMLRRRAYVDPTKICIFGLGTGANAALIAAEDDPAIAALVVDRPVASFDSAFRRRVGESYTYFEDLTPLFKWTFEMMYHVDTDRLTPASGATVMASRPVLLFDSNRVEPDLTPQNVAEVQEFLRHHLFDATLTADAR